MFPLCPLRAQDEAIQTLLFDTAEVRSVVERNAARLSPSILVLDPTRKTGTLTLTNPTDRELTVTLALEFHRMTTEATGAFTPAVDVLTSPLMPSLESWIKDFPESVALAPHESKRINIEIIVPTLKVRPVSSDEFWVQVIATSPSVEQSMNVVSRQLMHDGDRHTLSQQPAKGNITVPMVSTAKILYRPSKASAPPKPSISLGTPVSRLMIDGQAELCVPMRVAATRGIYARARITARDSAGRDTMFIVQHIDVPAGSAGDFQPCFQGILPIELTKPSILTLSIDDRRPDIPNAIRQTFSMARTEVRLDPVVPDNAPAVSRQTSADSSKQRPVPVFEVSALRGSLQAQLRREAEAAEKEGKIALLEIGAAWCGPCQAFLRSLSDSLMIDALRDARIVRVDFDHWGQAFVNGRFETPAALPVIFRINSDGTPGTPFDVSQWQTAANANGVLDARSMAPALKAFLREIRAESKVGTVQR